MGVGRWYLLWRDNFQHPYTTRTPTVNPPTVNPLSTPMIETTTTRITGTVVLTGELELVVDKPACYNLLTKVFNYYNAGLHSRP